VKTDRSKPDPRPERTRPEGVVEPRKPKKPAGAKPQPAHKKASYSNDKPKAAPKDGPKPGGYKDKGEDRPKGKSEPRPKGKEGGFSKPRSASGATGKSNKRSGAAAAPSGGGDAAKRYRAAANDTSKRFVPPGGKASARPPRAEGSKGAGKLRVSKGPNAVPRRPKSNQ
jgi:ATP-dependent RNA helicase DeaD